MFNDTKFGTGYCSFCTKSTINCTCMEDTSKVVIKKKFICVTGLRHLLEQYHDEQITFSRLVEIINEKAYKFYNNDKTETK